MERIFRNKCKGVSQSETQVSVLSFVMPTSACLGRMATNSSYDEAYDWHMMNVFIHMSLLARKYLIRPRNKGSIVI